MESGQRERRERGWSRENEGERGARTRRVFLSLSLPSAHLDHLAHVGTRLLKQL
jgi:hypothetical protein